MRTDRSNAALKQVAATYGVSVEEVTREINDAIQQARENSSPEIQVLWHQLFGVGYIPSAAEFVSRIAEILES